VEIGFSSKPNHHNQVLLVQIRETLVLFECVLRSTAWPEKNKPWNNNNNNSWTPHRLRLKVVKIDYHAIRQYTHEQIYNLCKKRTFRVWILYYILYFEISLCNEQFLCIFYSIYKNNALTAFWHFHVFYTLTCFCVL